MSDQLLIRDVTPEIRNWIEDERRTRNVTQKEIVIEALQAAAHKPRQKKSAKNTQLTLIEQPGKLPFTFVDLFAGVGGLRIGLEKAGGECLFSSEWDKYSQKTYQAWFGEMPHGDITQIDPHEIPDHDILAAGFPCQPFSLAGVSKKNSLGRAHGFACDTQGTLFYNVATIAEIKRPPVLMLENVKNLLSHDGGKTFKVIEATLKELDYVVYYKVIDADAWVPQHRERIFLVCFDKRVFGDAPPFKFPTPPETRPKFKEILEPNPDPKYTLSDHLWNYLQEYARRHQEKGNGFGFGMADMEGRSRTLSARYHKDGAEILIPQGEGKTPRRLTPREAARLQGFDDKFPIVVSDTQAYRQFGNAVCPLVSGAVALEIVETLAWQIKTHGSRCLLKGRVSQTA